MKKVFLKIFDFTIIIVIVFGIFLLFNLTFKNNFSNNKIDIVKGLVFTAISGIFVWYKFEKNNSLKYITEERTKWRETLREISEQLFEKNKYGGYNYSNQQIYSKLIVRLNAYGIVGEKEYLKDSHIFLFLDGIRKSNNESCRNKLSEYIALLLKFDWERNKIEADYWGISKYILMKECKKEFEGNMEEYEMKDESLNGQPTQTDERYKQKLENQIENRKINLLAQMFWGFLISILIIIVTIIVFINKKMIRLVAFDLLIWEILIFLGVLIIALFIISLCFIFKIFKK